MDQWKDSKLSDVAILVKDVYKPRMGDNFHYIGLEHIQEQALRLSDIGSSESVVSHKFYFKENDILFGKLRPYFRKVVKPNFSGVCSTDIWVIRAINGNDQGFLFYFFANQELVDTANSSDSGTRMPRADWEFLKTTVWNFPPPREQVEITALLSAFDEKIALLLKQNKTLADIAEAFFRYFFVDNRKTKWEACKVLDLADHGRESVHPNKNPNTLFYHYSIPAFDLSRMPLPELGIKIQSNKYKVTGNTILFSKLNPHKDKRVWLVPNGIDDNSICSTEFQVIFPKQEYYLYFLYGFINFSENYDEIAAGVGGTSGSHQRIDPEVLFDLDCFCPDEDALQNYNYIVEPLFEKINHNLKAIQSLTHQRDLLLPKLLSGEVRINYE